MRPLESIVATARRARTGVADTAARATEFAAALSLNIRICIDPRLNPLVPRVLGVSAESFIWLRNGGNIVTGPAAAPGARKRLSSPRRPVASPPLKTAAAIQSLRVATKAAASFAAALAFLLFTFLSVSSLHEASHQHDHGHGQSAEHACVLCDLAKSQVTGAEPAPVVTPLAVIAAPTIPSLVVRLELPAADRSLPPGRAPPVV